jgi:Protein of unknown function (DUF2948)
MTNGAGEPASACRGLRLRAEDAEDLAVISACLQDALVAVRDLAYDRAANTFVLAANRFCWEIGGAGRAATFARSLCLIAFEAVTGVAYRGFRRREEERILSLLAIRALPPSADGRAGKAATGATIDLEFAGGATVRLSVAAIHCRARDFGEPWPTRWQPGHSLDELA